MRSLHSRPVTESAARLALKNVFRHLHRQLKARAERDRRSPSREAILLPKEEVGAPAPGGALARAGALRERLADRGVWVTADEVLAAVDEGRP